MHLLSLHSTRRLKATPHSVQTCREKKEIYIYIYQHRSAKKYAVRIALLENKSFFYIRILVTEITKTWAEPPNPGVCPVWVWITIFFIYSLITCCDKMTKFAAKPPTTEWRDCIDKSDQKQCFFLSLKWIDTYLWTNICSMYVFIWFWVQHVDSGAIFKSHFCFAGQLVQSEQCQSLYSWWGSTHGSAEMNEV